MMKTIGIVKESNHKIVAMTPTNVRNLSSQYKVLIEDGAGHDSGFSNEDYLLAGAKIASGRKELIRSSNIVVTFNSEIEVETHFSEKVVIGCHPVKDDYAILLNYQRRPLQFFSLDLLPRNSTTHNMDVLYGIGQISGYQAVITGINKLNRIAPMMSGAGGALPPLRVLVLGTGVEGLQAITTSKHLGAIVFAHDTAKTARQAAEESGGIYIEEANSHGEEIISILKEADLVICCPASEGANRNFQLNEQLVSQMKRNAVVIDMTAGIRKGQSSLVIDGTIQAINGVDIIGYSQPFNEVPNSASTFMGNCFQHFIEYYNENLDKINENGILSSTLVIASGAIVNERIIQDIEIY